jgi:hypothetical protein
VGSNLDSKLARSLIRSLTRGTAVQNGVRFIHVGHENWLKAQEELLAEIAEDGRSDTKFIRGAYGAGKSHFLSVVQDRAREAGWSTCHIECKVDGVQIDRFETLYPKIAFKLQIPGSSAPTASEDGTVDPIAHMLAEWSRRTLRRAGVEEGALRRSLEADSRLYTQLHRGILRTNLPAEFTKALVVHVRATLANDLDVTASVAHWLAGAEERVILPTRYMNRPGGALDARTNSATDLRPIGRGTARDVMRGLLWLITATGSKGLVLCIDEIEELSRLTNKRQDQALQALREFVDDAGGDGSFRHMCMYLAATPEMFEGPNNFPRYDALQTRIQPLGPEINWRAPVIDLDRTPLKPDQLREMARRIREVHRIAYGNAPERLNDSVIGKFADEIQASRFRIAKPRLLARLLVDELERSRQRGAAYSIPADLSARLTETVTLIVKESEQ